MDAMIKRKLVSVLIVVVVLLVGVALVACAPKVTESAGESAGESTGESAGGDTANYPVGSLMAQHEPNVLNPEMEYKKKDCLSCHPRDAITAANENYGGDEGVNPHAAHTESYECVVCHSIDSTSVLKCNGCHSWKLPEGWESAPDENNARQITTR
jgi:hypothetical protein